MNLYKSKRRYYIKDQGRWYKMVYHPEVKLRVIRLFAAPIPHIDLREASPLEVLVETNFSLERLRQEINRVDGQI